MAVISRTAPSTPIKRRRSSNGLAGRNRWTTSVVNLVGIGFTVVMAFPVYWMVVTAFKPANEVLTFHPNFLPLHPTLDNFHSAINAPYFKQDMLNSLIITTVAVVFGILVGFIGALALARFRFVGRRFMVILLLAVQMVPLITVIIPIYLLLNNANLNLTNTLTGVVIVYIVLILPFTIWMLRGFISNVPRELDEAALVDGCTRFQMFYKILLPLTLPGLVSAAIYGFIQAWNEFFIINILTQSGNKANLMIWLTSNQTQHGTFWGPLMAGATLTSIPVVFFFLLIQKNVATGLTAGAVKG